MMTSPSGSNDVWPPPRARFALPFAALAVLVGTITTCFWIAKAHGHVWAGELPMISMLGGEMPEYACFVSGFTLLAALMAIVFRARARMLALEPRVALAPGLRAVSRACTAFAIISMGSMLVMAWVPWAASPAHFFAALATFGALALYEIAHAWVCIALARQGDDAPPPRRPGPLVRTWLFICPFAAIAFVYLWVSEGSALAQYAAVAMQFAYFLPLAPTLGESDARRRLTAMARSSA